MSREIAPFVAAMLLAAASIASAQDSHFRPDRQQIPTPGCLIMTGAWEGGSKSCSQNEHDAWLADIRHWRDERRIRIGYDGSRYDLPALKWTQSSFFQPQMMVEDRYFYDPVAHKYTVDRYLDDVEKRYGGIDAVLIWPTYPNMGIDNRNQHDMIRSMPGGVAGVKQMIADFHRRDVRVLFPDDDVGSRHAGTGQIVARRDRQPDGRDWRRRHQRRHAGWSPTRILHSLPTRSAIRSPSNRRADPRTRHWRGTS